MVLLGYFVAQTRGVMFVRAGDNVVFVRGDLQPVRFQLHDGWPSRTGVLFDVFRGQSHVYYKSVRDSAREFSVLVLSQMRSAFHTSFTVRFAR